jgi:hypothetical protein
LGLVQVRLTWEKPYKTEIVPVVSLLDSKKEAQEFLKDESKANNLGEAKVDLKLEDTQKELKMESQASPPPPLPKQASEAPADTKKIPAVSSDVTSIGAKKETLGHIQRGLSMSIKNVRFNLSNPAVASILKNVSQIFVSFEFLSYPVEELETPSSHLGAWGSCGFQFTKCKFEFLSTSSTFSRI